MILRFQIVALFLVSNLALALPHYSALVDWEPQKDRELARATLQSLLDAHRSAWAKEMGFDALSLDNPLHIPVRPMTPTGILSRGFVSEIFDPMVFTFASSRERLRQQLNHHPVDSLTLYCTTSEEGIAQRLAQLSELQRIRRLHFILQPLLSFGSDGCFEAMRSVLSSSHLTNLQSVRLSVNSSDYNTAGNWGEILRLPVMRQIREFYVESNTSHSPALFFLQFLTFDWSNLQSLGLDNLGLRNSDAITLASLPKLRPRVLSLRRNFFSLDLFQGLARHPGFLSQLEDVDLKSSGLRRGQLRFDQALTPLTRFPQLHTLRMANTHIRRGVRALSSIPLPGLRRLDISQGDDPDSADYRCRLVQPSPVEWQGIALAIASNTGLRGLRSLRIAHERARPTDNAPYVEGIQALADSTALPELRHLDASLSAYLYPESELLPHEFTLPSPRRGLPNLKSVRLGGIVNGRRLSAGPIQFLDTGPVRCPLDPQK